VSKRRRDEGSLTEARHLRLLCDHDVSGDVVDWLKKTRHIVTSSFDKGWEKLPDRELIKQCLEDRRVLITLDRDLGESQEFPICTHAGIILLRLRTETDERMIDFLKRFFQSGERKKCKHAIVTLREREFVIEDEEGLTTYRY
jgi:predicted nuclease of predicted toxin-antitoxin system